ncbi:MAG: hypothetical protein ABIN01_09120 [Ferruginibacter sp.]
MRENAVDNCYFIYGVNGEEKDNAIKVIKEEYFDLVFYVLTDIISYVSLTLARIDLKDAKVFFEKVMETAKEIRAKDEILDRIKSITGKLSNPEI